MLITAAYSTPPTAQTIQLYWGLALGPKMYSRNTAVTTSQKARLMALRSP